MARSSWTPSAELRTAFPLEMGRLGSPDQQLAELLAEYEKWQASLAKRFPLLYRGKRRGAVEFGLRGPGWFRLIEDLSAEIEAEITRLRDEENVPVRRLPRVVQIKEKFGQLRFYLNVVPPTIWDAVQEAEAKSAQMCELCGEPAPPSRFGEMVLCSVHKKKRR